MDCITGKYSWQSVKNLDSKTMWIGIILYFIG